MSIKTVLSILLGLTLTAIFLVQMAGCKQGKITGDISNTPVTQPEIPLLDKETHKSLETAYFAVG
jgi:hypothetical protein